MAESCMGCYHWRGVKDCEYCHYLLDTGFPRNCPADNCLFYKKEFFKMGKGHKIPEEVREKVLKAARDGVSPKNIARSLGIGLTSVHRILKSTEQKESPEAPTAMENASEDNLVDIGIKALSNLGKSLEKSFDTDTESITENPENVKPCEYSPYNPAVDDAVLERIERLRARIEELNHDIVCYEKEISAMMKYHEKCMEAVQSG